MGVLYRWVGGSEPTFEVRDDVLVLRALAEVGISPRALDDPEMHQGQAAAVEGGAEPVHVQKPWLGAGRWDEHATHWLLFVQRSGYALAADNGWLLKGWRKSRYTKQQAAADIAATLRAMGVESLESARSVKRDGSPGALQ